MIAPVLRFSRDKRGYEHFYLVQAIGRRGKTRPRILYWFRTPPHVKVGRQLFDLDVRRALERQFPDITFEWKKLLETPIPPPDTSERWRKGRRLERAAKAQPMPESEKPSADVPARPGAAAPEPASVLRAADTDARESRAGTSETTSESTAAEAAGGRRNGGEG